jgi:hypothetical protein
MYIKLKSNGEPEKYSISLLRRDNPNVSFSKIPTNETLKSYLVYPYTKLELPFNNLTQYKGSPVFKEVSGSWVLEDVILDKLEEEVEDAVRTIRNDLVKATDWWALPDTIEMSTEQKNYRNALRNVPQQSGFPLNVVWPDLLEGKQ